MAKTRGSDPQWRKSTHSGGQGCVEVRMPESDLVLVRDSKDPSGAVLTFNGTEWDAFIAGVKSAEFDRP